MSAARAFPALLEAFFTDRLIRQRQASPHTLASYRDTFCLLLAHAQRLLRKAPTDIDLVDLDTAFLGAFLDHLEQDRDNSARSRNVRLAAIHSFFRYVALHSPEHSALAQRVLAMPSKRYVRRPVAFLNDTEVAALLAAPDLSKWSGRRPGERGTRGWRSWVGVRLGLFHPQKRLLQQLRCWRQIPVRIGDLAKTRRPSVRRSPRPGPTARPKDRSLSSSS
jgi:integrase